MSAKGDSPTSLAAGLCGLLRRHEDFGPLCIDALHALALSIRLGGAGAATAALSAGAVELSLEWVGRRGGGALAEREMQAAGAAVLGATLGARTAVGRSSEEGGGAVVGTCMLGGSSEEGGAEEGGGRLAQAPTTAHLRTPATALRSASPAANASEPDDCDDSRRHAAVLRSAAQRLVSAGGVGIIGSALHAHANPTATTDHLVLAFLGAYRALHASAHHGATFPTQVLALLGAYRVIAPTFADCWAQLEDVRVLRACSGIVLAPSSGTGKPEDGGASAACAHGALHASAHHGATFPHRCERRICSWSPACKCSPRRYFPHTGASAACAHGAHSDNGAQRTAAPTVGNGHGALSVLRSRASRHAVKASLHLLCTALLMRTHGATPGGAVSGASGTPTHSCARGAGEARLGTPLGQLSAASVALSSAVLQLLAALARLAVETRHDAPKLWSELECAAPAAAGVPHVLRADREGEGS